MNVAVQLRTTAFPDQGQGRLEVRNVSKSFVVNGAPVEALRGVSLDVAAGEFVVLLGPSGCGKSTTGRAILRLVDPTSGHVIINGTDVAGLSRRAMRPRAARRR